jgi:integrase
MTLTIATNRSDVPASVFEAERELYAAGVATNTARSYAAAWRVWADWCGRNEALCQERGGSLERPSPGMLTAFITGRIADGIRPQTIDQNLSGIAWWYRQRGVTAPVDEAHVRMIVRGAHRKVGSRPVRKAAISAVQLARMTTGSPPRDRAILLFGFAGGFRRSELANLRVSDVTFTPTAATVVLRGSKGDRQGRGVEVVVGRTGNATCPVAALEAWLSLSGRTGEDPVFGITPYWVACIVKQAAERIGLDPDRIGGHSLRAGFVTEAVNNGVDPVAVAQHVRHDDLRTTMGYVRRRDAIGLSGRVGL